MSSSILPPLLGRADSLPSLETNIVNGSPSELTAFIVLNFIPAHIGLPFLVGIITFSKKVQRHPTFVNLLLSFILTGIILANKIPVVPLVFWYASGPEPPKGLCLLQASLIYGIPPLTSMTAFFLIFQMWSMIKASFEGNSMQKPESSAKLWAMIVAPYVGFTLAGLITAIYGAQNPQLISRNRRFFYCSVKADPITNTLTVVAAAFLLATLVFGCWTVVILYKRFMGLRRQGISLNLSFELNLPIRVLAFGVYITLAMSLSLLSISSPASPVPDLAIASAATFVLVCFGTQIDIFKACMFWRKDQPVTVRKTANIDLKGDV
ncbi:hypothetical protein DL96DRAFT_1554018 [Flagelloscypha sp. PMI_526]|nr:hypothetical protein DL96DRAFT_1554018 [Flagelloscypha sp. PMI_526]